MSETNKSLTDWQELAQLIAVSESWWSGADSEKSIAIEGSFELPQLARLALEDQIFIIASFVLTLD